MAKCDICGKGVTFGIKLSHSHRRSNRAWKPNVKRVKAVVNGSPCHINGCTRCLRSNKVTRAVEGGASFSSAKRIASAGLNSLKKAPTGFRRRFFHVQAHYKKAFIDSMLDSSVAISRSASCRAAALLV